MEHVEHESAGDYFALVARLHADAQPAESLCSTRGATGQDDSHVAPIIVVRLWRTRDRGILRGTIRLHESQYWAPLQSDARLERLLSACLAHGNGAGQSSAQHASGDSAQDTSDEDIRWLTP